jgi:hypothetical protein
LIFFHATSTTIFILISFCQTFTRSQKWRAKLRAASEAGLQRAANRQSTSTTTLIPKPSVAAQSTAPVAQSAPAQTASALPSLGVPVRPHMDLYTLIHTTR